jgi:hypothetical protein
MDGNLPWSVGSPPLGPTFIPDWDVPAETSVDPKPPGALEVAGMSTQQAIPTLLPVTEFLYQALLGQTLQDPRECCDGHADLLSHDPPLSDAFRGVHRLGML